jgi:hypothetical protein
MTTLTRRQALGTCAGLLGAGLFASALEPAYRLATFVTEVTPPLGHPLMGGGIAPAQRIDDPLWVHGLILLGAGKPIVLAAVDWCEIRNDAYDRWRTELAAAAETEPQRVLVTALHQHDAPIADLTAEQLLLENKAKGSICLLDFHEEAVQRVKRAVRDAVKRTTPVTHVGTGQAKVEGIASNRRYLGPDGKPQFGRMSATRDEKVRAQPEGTIDPFLKTISFWNGDRPLAALSSYATHPMSYYGKGGVSADFVGLARQRRQADDPKVFQLYTSGCSGNVTAGKFNDGAPDNRSVLADRLNQGMLAAWKVTERQPLGQAQFRSAPLRLEPRDGPGFTVEDLKKRLASDPKPFGQCLAALGLSWRQRVDGGHKLDVPCLDFGRTKIVLLPAESYVEYQLLAQSLRPSDFVLVMGYGECAPGYIPIERAVQENDSNLSDWSWVAPGAEQAMTAALKMVLKEERAAPPATARPIESR